MIRILFFISFIFLLSTSTSWAEQKIYREISLKGKTAAINVTKGTKEVIFYALSSGNLSSTLKIYTTKPNNVDISISAAELIKDSSFTLSRDELFYPLTTLNERQLTEQNKKCVEVGTDMPEGAIDISDFPPVSSPVCNLYSSEDIAALAAQLSATFGGSWGPGNVCAYLVFVSNNPDLGGKDQWCKLYPWEDLLALGINCYPDSFFSTNIRSFKRNQITQSTHTSILHKDNCQAKPTTKYLVRFKLTIPNSIKTDFPLTISAYEYKLKKGKPSLLKPESDGRYAPQPIFLMSYNGQSCGNQIFVTKFRNKKLVSKVTINPYTLYFHKQMMLLLGVASKGLTGGKGTVEIFDGNSSYGVCFDLVRRRQEKNGFPKR